MLKVLYKFKVVVVNIEDRFRVIKDKKFYFFFGIVSIEDFEKILLVIMMSGRNFLFFEYNLNERVIIIDNIFVKKMFGDIKLVLG